MHDVKLSNTVIRFSLTGTQQEQLRLPVAVQIGRKEFGVIHRNQLYKSFVSEGPLKIVVWWQ